MKAAKYPLLHAAKRLLMKSRRQIYGLRAWLPGLREQNRMERMVGPVGFWDKLQRYQLQALRSNGLEPEHHLLDIGCGPLQGGIAFIRYLEPSRYTGVDIDPRRLKAAYSQISRHDLAGRNPRLLLSSTLGDQELNGDRFDYMWASQLLYYFNAEKLVELLAFIRRRLNPGGKFLGDILGPKHDEFRHPEFGWILHGVEAVQLLAETQDLQARSLGEIIQFDYPSRLSLRSNLLLEITRRDTPRRPSSVLRRPSSPVRNSQSLVGGP